MTVLGSEMLGRLLVGLGLLAGVVAFFEVRHAHARISALQESLRRRDQASPPDP